MQLDHIESRLFDSHGRFGKFPRNFSHLILAQSFGHAAEGLHSGWREGWISDSSKAPCMIDLLASHCPLLFYGIREPGQPLHVFVCICTQGSIRTASNG